jgi:hypothetical protein
MAKKQTKKKGPPTVRDAQLMKLRGKSFLLVRFDAEEGSRVTASFSEKDGLKIRFNRLIALERSAKKRKGVARVARG